MIEVGWPRTVILKPGLRFELKNSQGAFKKYRCSCPIPQRSRLKLSGKGPNELVFFKALEGILIHKLG